MTSREPRWEHMRVAFGAQSSTRKYITHALEVYGVSQSRLGGRIVNRTLTRYLEGSPSSRRQEARSVVEGPESTRV